MRDFAARSIFIADSAPEEAVVCLREMAAAFGYREALSFATNEDHAAAADTASRLEWLGEHVRDLCAARAEDLRRSLPEHERDAYVDAAEDDVRRWFDGLRVEWSA